MLLNISVWQVYFLQYYISKALINTARWGSGNWRRQIQKQPYTPPRKRTGRIGAWWGGVTLRATRKYYCFLNQQESIVKYTESSQSRFWGRDDGWTLSGRRYMEEEWERLRERESVTNTSDGRVLRVGILYWSVALAGNKWVTWREFLKRFISQDVYSMQGNCKG